MRRSLHTLLEQPPNVAVMGCGAIVRRGHLPALLIKGKARVPVIFGPDTPNSLELAQAFGIPRLVHNFEEVFETPDLDAVVIALPNHQHGPAAFAAIKAGLPILLEKPIAADIETARAIVAAADAAGVRLVMSLPQRQRSSLIHIRELVRSGSLGHIETIDIRMTRRAGIPGYGGWFTQKALAGGGVLMDLGPHVIDTAFWLGGCAQATSVMGHLWGTHGPRARGLGEWGTRRLDARFQAPIFDVEDRAWFAFKLASGTLVTCEVAWALYGGDENRIRVVGDRGGADYWPGVFQQGSALRFYRDGDDAGPADQEELLDAHHDAPDVGWTRVAETFVDDLGLEKSRLVSGAEALVAAELIQEIYDSTPITGLTSGTELMSASRRRE